MSKVPRVLIVEDQIGDLLWLFDLIRNRGYEVVLATNEIASRKLLDAVSHGLESCSLVILDVMIAVDDFQQVESLDEHFFESSLNSGIRLCRYARQELALSAKSLPIVCLTQRDDDEVRAAMAELKIPLFNKAPHNPSESIRQFIERFLPTLPTLDTSI